MKSKRLTKFSSGLAMGTLTLASLVLGTLALGTLSLPAMASISDTNEQQNTTEAPQQKADKFACDDTCEKQVSELKRLARNGSPAAQTLLAVSYKTGDLTEKNSDRAWKWIKPAVRARYAPALLEASKWYRIGYAKEIDIEKANEYLDRAIAKNYPPALVNKGILEFNNGNLNKSHSLLSRAAEQGNPKAKKLLAKYLADSTVSPPSKKNNNVQTKSESAPSENKITIVALRHEPMELFNNFIAKLDNLNVYDKKGHTGSRASFRKCGQGGSACRVIYNSRTDESQITKETISASLGLQQE